MQLLLTKSDLLPHISSTEAENINGLDGAYKTNCGYQYFSGQPSMNRMCNLKADIRSDTQTLTAMFVEI